MTDHDRPEGALKMAAETDFLIIPGIEVSSPEGHIVALNVPEPVSGRLSSHEIVDRIHVAGGIAGACHPSARYKQRNV